MRTRYRVDAVFEVELATAGALSVACTAGRRPAAAHAIAFERPCRAVPARPVEVTQSDAKVATSVGQIEVSCVVPCLVAVPIAKAEDQVLAVELDIGEHRLRVVLVDAAVLFPEPRWLRIRPCVPRFGRGIAVRSATATERHREHRSTGERMRGKIVRVHISRKSGGAHPADVDGAVVLSETERLTVDARRRHVELADLARSWCRVG